jgi:hypothetical protein
MELHAALQAATGEKPRRRRNRDTHSQEMTSLSESEFTQDPALHAEETATTTEGAELNEQKLDYAKTGAQSESSIPAAADHQHEFAATGSDAGSSSAQLTASSSAVDDSEPEVATSESDDGAESSDLDLADLADPVMSDALADSESEEEPSEIDVAALRDADIQQLQKRANVLRGQMK